MLPVIDKLKGFFFSGAEVSRLWTAVFLGVPTLAFLAVLVTGILRKFRLISSYPNGLAAFAAAGVLILLLTCVMFIAQAAQAAENVTASGGGSRYLFYVVALFICALLVDHKIH